MIKLITPDWQAPANVRAISSTRHGGTSAAPWDSLNLGAHCGDDIHDVELNRQRLYHAAAMPEPPVWLEQVHGNEVLELTGMQLDTKRADASWTERPETVCAVMTADCLPVLLCNRAGNAVAAVHAGWRGLCHGIIENTVAAFRDDPGNLLAWLGPAIGPDAFEVGEDVRDAFIAADSQAFSAFHPLPEEGKFLADIYHLARQRLANCGVITVSGGDRCTYSEKSDFFSYRRDRQTGRMATFIWLI